MFIEFESHLINLNTVYYINIIECELIAGVKFSVQLETKYNNFQETFDDEREAKERFLQIKCLLRDSEILLEFPGKSLRENLKCS